MRPRHAVIALLFACMLGVTALWAQSDTVQTPGLADSTLVITVPPDAPRWSKFAAAALQGLANRQQATLYLLWGERESGDRLSQSERVWLDRFIASYQLKTSPQSLSDLPALASGPFKQVIHGLLVYPDEVIDGASWSPLLHIYAFIAGMEDLLPVPLSKRALFPGFSVSCDASSVRWGHSADEAYRYVYDHYRSAITSAPTLAHNHPSVLRMVDYYVADRILPLFYWQGIPIATQELFRDIIKESGPNKNVIGCWSIPRWDIRDFEQLAHPPGEEHVSVPSATNIQDEHEYVRLLNSYGKCVLVTSEMGIANLSYTSKMVFHSKPWESNFRSMKLDASKVYVAFTLTDGDNLSFWTNQGGFVDQVLNQKAHDLPMQWTFNLALVDLVPGLVDYLDASAAHINSFATGLSGYGYVMTKDFATRYPEQREALLREHFALSAKIMQRLGQRSVWWWYDYDDNKLEKGSGLDEAQWFVEEAGRQFQPLGLFNGYSHGHNYTPASANLLINGVPCFSNLRADIPEDTPEDPCATLIADHLASIANGLPRPAFINFTLHPNQSRGMVKAMQLLGDGYTAVNGDTLGFFYQQAHAGGK